MSQLLTRQCEQPIFAWCLHPGGRRQVVVHGDERQQWVVVARQPGSHCPSPTCRSLELEAVRNSCGTAGISHSRAIPYWIPLTSDCFWLSHKNEAGTEKCKQKLLAGCDGFCPTCKRGCRGLPSSLPYPQSRVSFLLSSLLWSNLL